MYFSKITIENRGYAFRENLWLQLSRNFLSGGGQSFECPRIWPPANQRIFSNSFIIEILCHWPLVSVFSSLQHYFSTAHGSIGRHATHRGINLKPCHGSELCSPFPFSTIRQVGLSEQSPSVPLSIFFASVNSLPLRIFWPK